MSRGDSMLVEKKFKGKRIPSGMKYFFRTTIIFGLSGTLIKRGSVSTNIMSLRDNVI